MIYELETIISGFIPWVEDEDSTDLEIKGLCKYYIAVHASIDSQYALSIHYEDGTMAHRAMHTSQGQYAYYYCVLSGNDNDKLTVLVTVSTKICSFMSNLDWDNDLRNNIGSYDQPKATNKMYASHNGLSVIGQSTLTHLSLAQ